MQRMPVLFVGHGSPMNSIEENVFTDGWRSMARDITKPKAILCVSAHWFVEANLVSAAESPKTIHDFYGFPESLYEITYPTPGAPAYAQTIVALSKGVVQQVPDRGLDHGAWSVLRFMYPKADVPVLQLSVHAGNTPAQSFQMGRMLSALRGEGVLIIGSGNIVHNLSLVSWDMEGGFPWADDFDRYIKTAILSGRYDDVLRYTLAGGSANHAFVGRDHYDPLLYALGATDAGESIQVYNDARVLGSLSMTSYRIG